MCFSLHGVRAAGYLYACGASGLQLEIGRLAGDRVSGEGILKWHQLVSRRR